MKAVVAAFNQEKALVGAFSVITNLRMELFEALVPSPRQAVLTSGFPIIDAIDNMKLWIMDGLGERVKMWTFITLMYYNTHEGKKTDM